LWTVIAGASRLANLRTLIVQFDRITRLNWLSREEFEAEWRWALNESPHLKRLEVFAPGTGKTYRDLPALQQQGWAARTGNPQPDGRSRPGRWQIVRRALGRGDG
jgi:hypothetical protein